MVSPISSVSAYGNGSVPVTKQRLDVSNAQNDFGLKNQNTSQERLSAIRNIELSAQNTQSTIREQDSLNAKNQFGLNNNNTASERLDAIRSIDIQNETTPEAINRQNAAASSNELGLKSRDTVPERLDAIRNLKQRVIENHGFDAKQAQINRLARNTMITNIPPLERGSLLDERI